VGTRIEVFGDTGSAVIENDRLGFLHLARDDQEVGAYGVSAQERARRQVESSAGPLDQAGAKAEGAAAGGTAADPKALAVATHAAQIADMIRAIREDGTPLVDGEAARHPVEIILAIYDSARAGTEVALS
jgi:predicted dehydrogenase